MSFFASARYILPLLTAFVMAVFAAMTGFTPSVVRACIMSELGVIAFCTHQEYDPPTGLSAACLVMLAFNPFVIISVSFQLSVSCVVGIVSFGRNLTKWMANRFPTYKKNKIIRGAVISTAISLSAMVFSLPFSVYYFETVSLIGPVSNLICLWAVSIIFSGVGVVCLISIFCPAWGMLLAKPVSWMIRFVIVYAKTVARFPFAAIYACSPWMLGWLIFCGLLLVAFLVLGRKRGLWYLSAAGITFALAITISCSIPRLDEARLTVLNVGEGQSILLQSKGKTFLVDCGGRSDGAAADAAANMLLSQGIHHIDGAALTHYDSDHSGGLSNFLSRISVDDLYFPDMNDKRFEPSLTGDYEIHIIQEDTQIPLGVGIVTLFQPGTLKTDNENCMCVLFDTRNCDILITGDRGKAGEKRWLKDHPDVDVDVLIGGHHGSKNSTSEELLEAVKPETVIFSVGANNSYGHPAEEVLERLKKYNCQVYRTDLDGTVVIRR